MRRLSTGLLLGLLLAWTLPAAHAQVAGGASEPEEVQPAGAVRQAMTAWVQAWRATPRLVSLRGDAGALVDADPEERIKLLGEKTFSNREWKTYWERQRDTASALANVLREAGDLDHADALARWTALANDKVLNQDRYFEAIQTERDAVENRIEATLEPLAPADEAPAQTLEPTNPYERRRLHLTGLDARIEIQGQKRRLAQAEQTFIQRQIESETILAEALARDLELAKLEQEIAQRQARDIENAAPASSDASWDDIWAGVARVAEGKVRVIGDEVDYLQVRARARQVEIELTRSQVEFRARRVSELEAERREASGPRSLAKAAWETVVQVLTQQAWKALIVLVLIFVAVRVALRVLGRATALVVSRMDDDVNTDDDGDQRRKTLADVFSSVARMTIYTVAFLIALDQVGVNTGPLLGSVAILGLAISFGSQNLVRDVVNGFFILLENQYAVGDIVTLNGNTGTVDRITIRSTWIRAYSGDLHVVPNGTIGLVSNLTRGWSRAICDVGVGYGADLEKAKEVVNEAGAAMYADPAWSEVLEEAPTWVGVVELGDSAVVVRAHVKTRAGSQWGTQRELYQRLKGAFDVAGIEIPFPQRVVHSGAGADGPPVLP